MMTKKEQTRVRDWCSGWFDLERQSCTLADWIRIKLGVTGRKAAQYAEWLEADRKERQL